MTNDLSNDMFLLHDFLKTIEYRQETHRFHCYTQYDRLWMYMEVRRPDAVTGIDSVGKTLPIVIEKDWNKDQILRQALKLALSYEEHEVREQFKFQGKAIFGPHVTVDNLLKTLPDPITHPEGKSGAW